MTFPTSHPFQQTSFVFGRLAIAIVFAGIVLPASLRAAPLPPPPAVPAPAPAPGAPAPGAPDVVEHPVEKPVRTLISAVRYGKFDLGLKYMAGPAQGQVLLADEWPKATEAQRTEFVALFHKLFAKVAFPKMKDKFQHLETIVYDAPEVKGDTASLKSTIVVLHALKKQELKLRYSLVKVGADWKLVDVSVLGDSMLLGIREDQIVPILKEGGWPKLLELMRKKAA